MTINSINDFLSQFVSGLTTEELVFFQSKLEKIEYKKNDTILDMGSMENHLGFLEKGVVRYFIPTENKDITLKVIFENDFVSSYASLVKRQPSKFSIVALSDIVMWRLTHDDLQKVFTSTVHGNYIGRVVLEWIYIEKSDREISFLTQTAEEKYLKLLKEHKQLIKNIPLKYIASYIGITPQALSRIRNRIS